MMSVWQQCYYLLKRNAWMKRRNARQSIQELLWPVYFVAIMAAIRLSVKPETLKEIQSFAGRQDINTFPSQNSTVHIGFYPGNHSGCVQVMNEVRTSLTRFINTTHFELLPVNKSSDELANLHTQGRVFVGVIFNPRSLNDYTIRFPASLMADTNDKTAEQGKCRKADLNYNPYVAPNECPAYSYITSGFTALQVSLDMAIIDVTNSGTVGFDDVDEAVKTQMFPKSEYPPNIQYLQSTISIYMVWGFSPMVNFLLVNLVTEKEKKIKEGMKMMGLSDMAFWLSWFITYGIIMLVTVLITAVISVLAILPNSNFFIVFIMYLGYGLSVISFSFMLTPFFNKAVVAGAIGSFSSVLFSVLALVAVYLDLSPGVQWVLSLLSPTAFGFGLVQMVALDSHSGGATFSNFVHVDGSSFSPGASFLMLIIDTIIYWLAAMYLDNVVPGDYGQSKPFYYCLMPSYWWSWRKVNVNANVETPLLRCKGNGNETSAVVEPVPPELRDKERIRICGLKKEFVKKRHHCSKEPDEIVTAIDGLYLSMYEDQITALLGHNGAGKSTLVACLTGLTPTTSGDASIYGRQIVNDIANIRKMIGVCPQHDVLFPNVTTKEHLIVFAGIKGLPKHEIDQAVTTALEEVGLTDHADTMATKLSGGQKRKLSVAIALIGDPKVVFLDEPSSGMDPYSRRQLWSLLQSKKPGRVILLTTHFMDEADILADRKAVLSKGKLQVVGSSLFLKNKFGIGYHLGMVVEPSHDVEAITSFVEKVVPSAELSRTHGMELAYTLPLNNVQLFPTLFSSLEETSASGRTVAADLGIQSYGVSMTTLEEVFLHLEEIEEQESQEDEEMVESAQGGQFPDSQKLLYGASSTHHKVIQETGEVEMNDADEVDKSALRSGGSSLVDGGKLFWQQFLAMLSVRYLIAFRVPASVIFRLIIPPIMVVVGVLVSRNIVPNPAQPGALSITPDLYLGNMNPNVQPPYCKTPSDMKPSLLLSTYDGSNASDSYHFLVKQFRNQSVGYCQPSVSVSKNNTDFNKYLLNNWPHSAAVELGQLNMTNKSIAIDFTAWYNDTEVHSLPVTINVMNSALYTNLTGNTTGIKVTNHPFEYADPKLPFDAGSYVSVLLIGLALIISPGGFAIILVTERETRVSHQLQVSGLNRLVYWLTTLASDLSLYLVTVVLIIILVPALDLKPFEPQPAIGLTILVLFISMPVQALYAYVWSFAFSKGETCQSILPMIITFLGIIPYVAVGTLYAFEETVSIILNYIFMVLSPPYTSIGCLYFISTVYQQHFANPFKHDLSAATYFSFSSHVIPGVLVLLAHMVVLSLLLIVLDKRSIGDRATCANCCRCGSPVRSDVESPNDDLGDDDVKHEKQVVLERVAAIDNQSDMSADTFVLMEGLKKEFMDNPCCKKQADIKVKVAVQDLHLSVKAGEIFGLLGPNGAGKTTAMNVFTGDMTPTEGRVFLANEDITCGVARASLALGYCPQVDALWPEITLKEHLRTYAWIKGVPREATSQMITRFAEILKVTEHIDKRAKELSGGTKRKLSFLMSMVGGPKVLLLDEPSTGMDPKAKRSLWSIISDCITDQRAAILTTHSMEEADALCSRIGILVSGSLRCVGSTQHLKSKYGAGYHLEMKLSSTAEGVMTGSSHSEEQASPTSIAIARQTSALAEADCDHASDALTSLVSHVKETFSGAQLVECFGDRATFAIPAGSVQSLSTVFAYLERTKAEFGVEEYSLSQSSLEQVFISFAKQQRQED